MAHDIICDYHGGLLEGYYECVCEFVEHVRKDERKRIASKIGVEVLHQRSDDYPYCKGCLQNPCELDQPDYTLQDLPTVPQEVLTRALRKARKGNE